MVFGELLGGLAMRGGQRMHEDLLHQRKIEDWQREQDMSNLSDFIAKNWDNLDADQQGATTTRLAKLMGKKPEDMQYMITAAKGVHSMIPQIQATQESLGPNTPPSSVAVTPSREAPVTVGQGQYAGQQIQAPAAIEFGQVPSPASVLSPSIMAPTTGGEVLGPSYTPNQVKSQQAADMARNLRQQRISEIRGAGLSPDLEMAALGKQVGDINAVPVITSQIGADAKRDVAESQANQFRGAGRLVIRNGMPLPVRVTGKDEFILDPQKGWIPLVPQQGDEVYEKPAPLGTVTGAKDVYSLERSGPAKGTVKPLGVGIKPAATNSGAAASRSFKDEMALRKDFENHPITKQADETARQVKLAKSALARGSANFVAIDQALINVFNKMIDPNSVVREGEYARTIDNTPLLNRIKGKAAAIMAGGAGLTPEERKELVSISERFATDSQLAYTTRSNEYKRIATEHGFRPENVVVSRTGTAGAGDYGPIQDFNLNGKIIKGRRNLKTGKVKPE